MRANGKLDALILAGGLGTRLRAAVADRPKVLAPVSGRPFVAHLLDRLARAGVPRSVLCVGYLAEMVRHTLGHSHLGMGLAYSEEGETLLGTGGALRLALDHSDAEHFLVLNGDSWLDADLPSFDRWCEERGAEAALALTRVPDCARFGRVELDGDDRITAFVEKGEESGPGWINAGVYLVSRACLELIPAGRPVSLEREIFPLWIERGLYGYRSEAAFLDIGTPESYRAAEEILGAVSVR